MNHWYIFAMFVCLSLRAGATTLHVDGPGDGDSNGTDDFDSVRAALMALGETTGSDGVSDEIRLMVNALTEPVGMFIPGGSTPFAGQQPINDDITIEGDGDADGNPCVLAFTGNLASDELRAHTMILWADGQIVTIRDLSLILGYFQGKIATSLFLAEPRIEIPGMRSGLTLERVILTASLPGNAPVDVESNSGGWSIREFGGNGMPAAMEIHSDAPSAELVLKMRDCAVAHQGATGLEICAQRASIEIAGSRIRNNGYFDSVFLNVGDGLTITIEDTASLSLDHTRVERNYFQGCEISTGSNNVNSHQIVRVGAGCEFNQNGSAGLNIGASNLIAREIVVSGTELEPIAIMGNGADGFRVTAKQNSTLIVRHIISCQNRTGGVVSPLANSFVDLKNLLISESLRLNLLIASDITPEPRTIEISDSTFHELRDTGRTPFAPPEFPTHLGSPAGQFDEVRIHIELTNCVFSGSSDETTLDLSNGTIDTVTFNQCAVVKQGMHAIGSLNATGFGVITQNGVINADPIYVNTSIPPDSFSFDVRGPEFAEAGPGGAPLTGWGGFSELPLTMSGVVLRGD